jgi:hypothetical protein
MLRIFTAHPEEHEGTVSAMAFVALDPGRLDQPPTAERHRVPPDGESDPQREKLGKKRILLSDDQRRRLAVKSKILGRKMLEQLAGIVIPDTILRWHHELVARHRDFSGRRKNVGRPPLCRVPS